MLPVVLTHLFYQLAPVRATLGTIKVVYLGLMSARSKTVNIISK